jgi:hypothetical protein
VELLLEKATTEPLVCKLLNHYHCGDLLDYFLSYFVCFVEILTAHRTLFRFSGNDWQETSSVRAVPIRVTLICMIAQFFIIFNLVYLL